jgi:murein DD-endopeptidase MepM/ murein hydrolase activator NlpD
MQALSLRRVLFAASALVVAGSLSWHDAQAAGALQLSVDARALAPGEMALVTVAADRPLGGVRVHIFGKDLPAFEVEPNIWQALVGIDLDVKPGAYTLSAAAKGPDGPLSARQLMRVGDKKFPTRRLTVDESYVNPPAELTDRILREAKQLSDLWPRITPKRLWTTGFVRPVPQAANSAFGTRSIYNGQPRSPHSGADFPSPAGTPIKSPNAGRVVIARNLYYTGNTVVIDHGLGLYSVLAHMSAMDVHEGDTVEAGQVVGKVGATGRVTGAHLHWGLRVAGARVDPLSLLAVEGN